MTFNVVGFKSTSSPLQDPIILLIIYTFLNNEIILN